jgi:hypothetical protein
VYTHSLIYMQLPQPNVGPRGDPLPCFRMPLTSFWFSSFPFNCYSASSSIAGKRGMRAPFTWARQNEFRLALVALLAYLHRIEVSWRCPVASSAVPSVGSALSPSSMLAIDLATTGLKSRNLVVGANVSSCSVVKRLVVSEGREELTTKATTCC